MLNASSIDACPEDVVIELKDAPRDPHIQAKVAQLETEIDEFRQLVSHLQSENRDLKTSQSTVTEKQ